MLLKKIRMVGFKSFADETIVEPGKGITAVVGPNGCGKSNIVDAVRWVLGEKSGRALRGKSMEDVIFMGSEHRKPGGMAEVELYFDNGDRHLGLDQDEVVFGRRIYTNSASDYILNGKKSTRREMERIFMDTGIGKTAYSIMEQGRMSEILKASPEERRNLFDEAAGVSRFKSERAETLARLKDTEQNLLRLNDILKAKKDELEHLERQARKTRQYLKLKEYLDRFDRHMRYLGYLDLQQKRAKVEGKLKSLYEKRDAILEKVTASEGEIESQETENENRVEEMHRKDREFHQDLSRIEAIQENLSRLDGEHKEKQQRLETLKERKAVEERQHKEIAGKVQATLQMELDMESEIQALQSSSSILSGKITELETKLRDSVAREESNQQALIQIEERQAALLEDLKDVTHELIIELESRKNELLEKDSRRESLRVSIQKRLSTWISSIEKNKTASIAKEEIATLQKEFSEYESVDNEFRAFLFGKSGLLTRKEELDRRMGELQEEKERLQKENGRLFEQRKLDAGYLDKEKSRKVEMDLQIRDFQARRESSVEVRQSIEASLKEAEERLRYYETELNNAILDFEKSAGEGERLRFEVAAIRTSTEKQTGEIEEIRKVIEKTRTHIHETRERIRKDREQLERMLPEISEAERSTEAIHVAESTLQEELYNDFQISLGELISECEKLNLKKDHEEGEYRRIKGEIVALGQFNALAIEEEERSRTAYDQLVEQRKDIEEARKNILQLLNEIDEKTRVRFLDTFHQIQNNFQEVFQTLFNGGSAALNLTDEADPMAAGVEIMVQPPGKKNSSITLLSGGEQNMTAVALMFATYLVRPSPFCLLDEIDAPLDDTNVNRFLKMLGGFAGRSQFLMITHNKLSMMKSEAIFGVTQEEAGVSKIVSVKMRDAQDMAGHV